VDFVIVSIEFRRIVRMTVENSESSHGDLFSCWFAIFPFQSANNKPVGLWFGNFSLHGMQNPVRRIGEDTYR